MHIFTIGERTHACTHTCVDWFSTEKGKADRLSVKRAKKQ